MDAHSSRQLISRARAAAFAVAVVTGPLACANTSGAARAPGVVRPPEAAAHDALSGEPRGAAEVLPFIHDDYARALQEARRTNRPLFVDAWAPWCHSCQSMRAYVLGDRSLAPLAKDFVWLSVDTEKASNAAFVERFPNRVWPTLWVLDAASAQATLRWEGTATAPELLTLLATVRAGREAGAAEATMTFLRANQFALRGDVAQAEQAYRAVLAKRAFGERPRAAEALASLLASKKDFGGCTDLTLAEAPSMPPGTSRAVLLATGLSCAREAKRDVALRTLSEAAERAANDPDPRTIADDRSALFEELVETKKEQGDHAGAKALAETWASFLEREAARAPTRQARAVFDPHRLSAYLAAGQPERAIPLLTESERDFPDDYNPPARLATVYLAARRLDDAKAAVERAAGRVYGPRSMRVFVLAADIAKARGDLGGERSALEQALVRTEHVFLNDRQKKGRAGIEQRLRALPR